MNYSPSQGFFLQVVSAEIGCYQTDDLRALRMGPARGLGRSLPYSRSVSVRTILLTVFGRSGHTKSQRLCSPVASRFGQSAFSISRHFIRLPWRPYFSGHVIERCNNRFTVRLRGIHYQARDLRRQRVEFENFFTDHVTFVTGYSAGR